jgi:hypothetical protein
MGAGLHGLNGVGPRVALHMLSVYVMPVLTYGLEALVLTERDISPLEKYYKNLLRQIQHLPVHTATPAVYLLLGCIPVEGIVDIKVLNFFGSITRKPGQVEHDIVQRQLAMKELSSGSWCVYIRRVLHKYELPSAYSLMNNPPNKTTWKKLVEQTVYDHWSKELKEQAATMSTLRLLDMDTCYPRQVHSVWLHNSTPLEAHMATVKARILVQRYPLYSSYCAGKKKSARCPLCTEEEETVQHFLLRCPSLSRYRMPYLREIYTCVLMASAPMPANQEDLCILILNPETYLAGDCVLQLETTTRRMIFKLHSERSVLLGGESEYRNRCRVKVGLSGR